MLITHLSGIDLPERGREGGREERDFIGTS